MIRKINRIFQDFLREKRLKIGKFIWDRKEKTPIKLVPNFIEENNINSILFLRYDGKIGDMVVNTFMFREIKKVYPNVKIAVVARGEAKNIIINNSNVDKIYDYKKDRKSIKKLATEIKNEKFDLLIDFSEMLRVNQMMFINLCSARINIGLDKENWNLFDISINKPNLYSHVTSMYIDCLSILGIKNINSKYDLYFNKNIIQELKLDNVKYCLINPYGASKYRTLNEENIEKIIKICESEKKFEKLVILIPPEKSLKLKVDEINSNLILFHTKNILEVIPLVEEAKLIISPDTSIIHIATTFEKNIVCIYRREKGKFDKNSIFWGPNNKNAKIIYVEKEIKNGDEININEIDLNKIKENIGVGNENISNNTSL